MKHTRYFNLTMIDVTGAASSTQVLSTDNCAALELLRERIIRGRKAFALPNPLDAWDKPLIAAFMYDTRTLVRTDYSIDINGKITQTN